MRLSTTDTTSDLNINNIHLQNILDDHNQTSTNDRRFNNINYVRNVLRKIFRGHSKKSTSINSPTFDDISFDQSSRTNSISNNIISPILIHSCLQFNEHGQFSGRNISS